MNVGSSSSSSTVDQFSSTSSLLSHLVKTSHILNGYRSPLHPSKESDSVCSSDETSDPMETDQPVSESDSSSSVKVIPIRSTSSDQNENKENIKEKMEEANQLTRQIHKLYSEMIGLGLAKEIARFWLPSGEYTTLFCQFDLNNLMKIYTQLF